MVFVSKRSKNCQEKEIYQNFVKVLHLYKFYLKKEERLAFVFINACYVMTIASHPTCESKAYSCIYKRNWEGGGAVRGVAIFLVFISSIDIKVRKY